MKNFLQKIKTLIKTYWLFILLSFIVALLISAGLFFKKEPIKKILPTPSPIPSSWQGIHPGITTESELKNKLGKPIKEIQQLEEKTAQYPSDFEFYPHEVRSEAGMITFIKQQVTYEENLNLETFLEEYDQPSFLRYEENLGNAFPLNVFLSSGLAIAAHDQSGQVLEIWYFEPMTEVEFDQTIGKSLFSQPLVRF